MTTAITPALMPRKHPAAATTPAPTRLSVAGRRNKLLAAIHQRKGVWTTGRVRAYYTTAITGQHIYESTARRDLLALWHTRHLDRHEKSGRVSYTLRTKGGTT